MKKIIVNDISRSLYRNLIRTKRLEDFKKKLEEQGIIFICPRVNSKKNTLKIAKKYIGTNFGGDHSSEYVHAIKNNYLDKLREILGTKKYTDHSKKRTLRVAKIYKGTSFSIDYPNEYTHAINNNYSDELRKILIELRKNLKEGRKEQNLEVIRNYKGTRFSQDHPREHEHATYHKYLSELYKKHSKEQILKMTKNYKGTRFSKDYHTEYCHARTHKYLGKLREILNERKIDLKERNLEVARNYKGICFNKDHHTEYCHAQRHKYLDKLNAELK